ncbi:MAG: tol-pal system protein YbgF [Desulfuromonadia bacterium]
MNHRVLMGGVLLVVCTSCGSHDRLLKRQDEIDARVDQVVRVQGESNAVMKDLSQQLAELNLRMKGMELELQQLKPGYSELRSTIASTSEKLEKLASDTARRLAEQPRPTLPPPEISVPGTSGHPASPPPSLPDAPSTKGDAADTAPPRPVVEQREQTPVELYTKAFRLYTSDRFDEARELFDQFLIRYPTHPYAPNALYWKGECYYSLKKFDLAYDIFTKVSRDYPKAGKVPDAILKQALTLAALGKVEQERELLKGLISKYPRSDAAAKARERLSKGGVKGR